MDMETLMAQAQELQNKVEVAQNKLANMSIKGIAEGGACVVDMSGKYDLKKLTIRPDILELGAERVAEIVASAYRDAKEKADKIIDEVMGAATAGMPIPR